MQREKLMRDSDSAQKVTNVIFSEIRIFWDFQQIIKCHLLVKKKLKKRTQGGKGF